MARFLNAKALGVIPSCCHYRKVALSWQILSTSVFFVFNSFGCGWPRRVLAMKALSHP
jgi:hypothetical protein